MKRSNIVTLCNVFACLALLLLVTACGGSSGDTSPPVETAMMHKVLDYTDLYVTPPNSPKSAQEALADNKTMINKLELTVVSEKCGNEKVPTYLTAPEGGLVHHFITIPKAQVELAKMIGYAPYIEEQKWNYYQCPY